MPTYARTETVAATPEHVFDLLADTDRTPEWNKRCTKIDRLSEGPTREGLEMRYHYKDGGRSGEMAGRVTAFEPGRHMTMLFTDKMMDVSVDFAAAPGEAPSTTTLTHTIVITPKGFGKLFTPLIKRQLPQQTLDAMTNVKALAER